MLENTTVLKLLVASESANSQGFENTAEALLRIAFHMNESNCLSDEFHPIIKAATSSNVLRITSA